MKKQILIEKYIEPSEISIDGNFSSKRWNDKYGDRHSIMGQPAIICYRKNKITLQCWFKKGTKHRDRDLPARIDYVDGQIEVQSWYKEGTRIKVKNFKIN
jgi:hypothetical protein